MNTNLKMMEAKLTEILTQADKSPMIKALLEEKAAAILAIRVEAAGNIEIIKKEQHEIIPKLQVDIAEKEKKYQVAKAALDAASDECNAARIELSKQRHGFDVAIGRHETVLFETADPAIEDAIAYFRSKLDYLRSPGRISRIAGGSERNIFTWSKVVREQTNAPAVNAALSYCMAAIKEIERMKLMPALNLERIEKMKVAIPSIDIYSDLEVTKDMDRGPADPLHPLTRMAEDSETEWKLKKLGMKFKDVMAK